MKQEGSIVARKGVSKVTVHLPNLMQSAQYRICFSIVEPKWDERPEELTMEVLLGRTNTFFVIGFNMKLPIRIKLAFIVEPA